MADGNIAAKVRQVIEAELGVRAEDLQLGASLAYDLGADSVALMQLSVVLEEEFDIEITDVEASELRTVRDAIECVERHASTQRDTPFQEAIALITGAAESRVRGGKSN